MKQLLAILFCSMVVQGYAQFPRVEIPGSEIRTITSSVVTGQEYALHILLPANYAGSTKKYPVVYLMDSQWDFPLLKSIYGQQYFDGFIPELIIVGVTWGGSNPNPDSLRVRDYTPSNDGRQVQSGGADKFLSFMRKELFPFVEKNYKADNQHRILAGCSLGGLFTLYTLFTQPDLFTGYAAASPAIGWGGQVIDQYEKKYATDKTTSPARLFMTIGGVERSVPGFQQFARQMSERNYPALKVKAVVLENTGHSGTKSETYSRGLQYIFERPALKLAPTILDGYSGQYKSANGSTVEIKNENGGLVLYLLATNKYALYAASDSNFYSTAELLTVYFSKDTLRLERYGSTMIFTKSGAHN